MLAVYAGLSSFSWRHINLSNANLTHADMRNSDLTDAVLSGATLDGLNLSDANLSGTEIFFAHMDDINTITAPAITGI